MHEAIWHFQDYIAKKTSRIEHICACYGLFTLLKLTTILQKTDLFFKNNIQSNFFVETKLDYCNQDRDNYNFCKTCFNSILKSNRPKSDYKNGVNMICCQNYSKELQDLTPIEETVITQAHLVISILKLRPVDISTHVTY